jgi:hypothetical protein
MVGDHVEPPAVPCRTGFRQQRISAMFLDPFVDIVKEKLLAPQHPGPCDVVVSAHVSPKDRNPAFLPVIVAREFNRRGWIVPAGRAASLSARRQPQAQALLLQRA